MEPWPTLRWYISIAVTYWGRSCGRVLKPWKGGDDSPARTRFGRETAQRRYLNRGAFKTAKNRERPGRNNERGSDRNRADVTVPGRFWVRNDSFRMRPTINSRYTVLIVSIS
jgi:hypothetical protein